MISISKATIILLFFLLGVFATGLLTIPSIKKELSQIENKILDLKKTDSKSIASLNDQIENFNEGIKIENTKQIAMLDEKILLSNKEIKKLERMTNSFNRRISRLSNEQRSLQRELERKENLINRSESETRQLRDSLNILMNEIQSEKRRFTDLRNTIETLITENRSLKAELKKSTSKLEDVKKSIEENNVTLYAKYKKSILSGKLIKIAINKENGGDISPNRIKSLIFDIEFFIDDIDSLKRIDLEIEIFDNNEKIVEFEDRFLYENYVIYHSPSITSIRKEIEVPLKSQKLNKGNQYEYLVRIEGESKEIARGEIKFK